MKFTFIRASRYFQEGMEGTEQIEINTLSDLENLEKSLKENETIYTRHEYPCNLIVDFEHKEITYYDFYLE